VPWVAQNKLPGWKVAQAGEQRSVHFPIAALLRDFNRFPGAHRSLALQNWTKRCAGFHRRRHLRHLRRQQCDQSLARWVYAVSNGMAVEAASGASRDQLLKTVALTLESLAEYDGHP
jgi:hypothetical protein